MPLSLDYCQLTYIPCILMIYYKGSDSWEDGFSLQAEFLKNKSLNVDSRT